ncbi:hypothetical protein C817_00336 [Dorea sp. 5-2]|nr:hypothetical protein C817_00336 [Dorea sp. 5-2]
MNQNTIEKAYCALELERKIVGMKFLHTEEEYAQEYAQETKAKMNYCVLVRMAMNGSGRKVKLEDFGCMSAARAFGMVEPDERWLSGMCYREKGMYRDLSTARKVVRNTSCSTQNARAIVVKPLEEYIETTPDVVLIVTHPYNIMRLIQGYTYQFGTYKEFKLIGNQAFCSECTAYPLESNEINISTLCSGTRYIANWKHEEMAMGIPFGKFETVIEGLYRTIDVMVPQKEKEKIKEKLKEKRRTDLELNFKMHEENKFKGPLYIIK